MLLGNDGCLELGHFAVDHDDQLDGNRSLLRVVADERGQATFELRQAMLGRGIGLEVMRLAGQQEAALSGLGALDGDLEGVEDPDRLAGVTNPGQENRLASGLQDRQQHDQREENGQAAQDGTGGCEFFERWQLHRWRLENDAIVIAARCRRVKARLVSAWLGPRVRPMRPRFAASKRAHPRRRRGGSAPRGRSMAVHGGR